MSYNREEWKKILELPGSALSKTVEASLKRHVNTIVEWVKGEPIEQEVSPGEWVEIKNSLIHFDAKTPYRVEPKVTISATLSVKQAYALCHVLEETAFGTEAGRKARNSIISSINTELQKMGH